MSSQIPEDITPEEEEWEKKDGGLDASGAFLRAILPLLRTTRPLLLRVRERSGSKKADRMATVALGGRDNWFSSVHHHRLYFSC